MLAELARTTTRDGVQLDGILQTPAAGSPVKLCVDASCVIHGTGGNFYSSSLHAELAERLLASGASVLRVNTRGHDGISTAVTGRGGKRQGAAYEIVDDCRHDLLAWLNWLRERSGPRVGLIGHSLGAVKALYAATYEAALNPAVLLAISPPRLAYSAFCKSAQAAQFQETYQRAERLFAGGAGAELMEVQVPLPYTICAAGYVEKYGPDERYNFLKFLGGVSCPVLVTLGAKEVENNMAFRGLPEEIGILAANRPTLRIETIAGADHFYTGVRPELWGCVEDWLGRCAASKSE